MYLIVGLGNPEEDYAKTRHNMGFMAVDRLAEKCGISVKRLKHRALIGEGRIGGQRRSVPGQRTREQLLENEQTSLQCESYREAEHTRYVCLQETLPPFQFIRHHQPA